MERSYRHISNLNPRLDDATESNPQIPSAPTDSFAPNFLAWLVAFEVSHTAKVLISASIMARSFDLTGASGPTLVADADPRRGAECLEGLSRIALPEHSFTAYKAMLPSNDAR